MLSSHQYWFDKPSLHLRLTCNNQTDFIHFNPLQEIEVSPGSKAVTDSYMITELKTSNWMMHDTVDLIADDLVMKLSNEQIDPEDLTADHYQHAQMTFISICLVLTSIVILFLFVKSCRLHYSPPPECTDW